MHWAADAVVLEDIPASKSTVRYTIKRCLSQGANYRRIMRARGEIGSEGVFVFKAATVFVLSLVLALPLVLLRHDEAGHWMKRAFSNLGKFYRPGGLLYQ